MTREKRFKALGVRFVQRRGSEGQLTDQRTRTVQAVCSPEREEEVKDEHCTDCLGKPSFITRADS